MSTPYGISTSIGSVTYDNYVNAPILGPLSTNNYPCAMPYHSYGVLTGIRPTPPQFYPSQAPPYAEENTNSRQQYLRASGFTVKQLALQKAKVDASSPTNMFYDYSTQKRTAVSTHMNYIVPPPSSLYTNYKKSIAIGKSSYKVGLPEEAPISTKCYYPSGTRTTIRRVRSGGCVAPKKKGAIENYSLRASGICAWGSLPRINY
jgi:hypothetical protein